jgi:hypothetical protein
MRSIGFKVRARGNNKKEAVYGWTTKQNEWARGGGEKIGKIGRLIKIFEHELVRELLQEFSDRWFFIIAILICRMNRER